jgi:hypothetical protein
VNDPHRPQGGSGSDLARLAALGHARAQAAHGADDARASLAANRNLKVAVGGYRGSPVKRLVLASLVTSVVGLVAMELVFRSAVRVPLDQRMPCEMAGGFIAFGCLWAYLFLPPTASRAAVEAERAWAASLPFPFERYFELLACDPSSQYRVRVELWWSTQGVDRPTLEGIVALFDPASRVLEVERGHAVFTTGPISGSTGIRVNRVSIYRNHRLAKAVHRLVDTVLLPIHKNGGLVRVRVSHDP